MVQANRVPLIMDIAAMFVTGGLKVDMFKDRGIDDAYSMLLWYN